MSQPVHDYCWACDVEFTRDKGHECHPVELGHYDAINDVTEISIVMPWKADGVLGVEYGDGRLRVRMQGSPTVALRSFATRLDNASRRVLPLVVERYTS